MLQRILSRIAYRKVQRAFREAEKVAQARGDCQTVGRIRRERERTVLKALRGQP